MSSLTLTHIELPIEGMTCAACATRIEKNLNKLPGVKCARPRGAFYVFPNITGTGRPSEEVAKRLLDEAGVAALSGTAFGSQGEGYLRLSYANSEANLRKALERMEPVFASMK